MNTPLRQWSLSRFKSIDQAQVDFAALTVLVGTNSSGKSTLLQSILLAVQAAQHDRGEEMFSLNGPLVSLGGYRDVKSKWAGPRWDFGFGGIFCLNESAIQHPEDLTVAWNVRLGEATDARPGASRLQSSFMTVDTATDHLEVTITPRHDEKLEPDQAAHELGSRLLELHENFSLDFTGSMFHRTSAETASRRTEAFGVSLRAGMPAAVLVEDSSINAFVTRAWRRSALRATTGSPSRGISREANLRAWDRARGRDDPEALVRESAPLFRQEYLRALDDPAERSSTPEISEAWRVIVEGGLPPAAIEGVVAQLRSDGVADPRVLVPTRDESAILLSEATDALTRFLADHVHYLGPLRQDPGEGQRFTPVGRPTDLGTRGEHTPWVLHAYGQWPVRCPKTDGSGEILELPLQAAVAAWAHELDIADAVVTKDLIRSGVDIRVRPRGLDEPIELANVGVGVSQLLPVIVLCLLAEPGSLILLEQPELHLHPAVQQRLGDFLLGCARSGRQLLIETHSEYLISRLRLRAVEDRTDVTRTQFAVVFATRDVENGRTTLESASANEYGAINWPPGFFDQSRDESRLIVTEAMKRRREQ